MKIAEISPQTQFFSGTVFVLFIDRSKTKGGT
jgi:hypothetical protein